MAPGKRLQCLAAFVLVDLRAGGSPGEASFHEAAGAHGCHVDRDDASTFSSQYLDHSQADALAGTRHNDHLIFKIQVHGCSIFYAIASPRTQLPMQAVRDSLVRHALRMSFNP